VEEQLKQELQLLLPRVLEPAGLGLTGLALRAGMVAVGGGYMQGDIYSYIKN